MIDLIVFAGNYHVQNPDESAQVQLFENAAASTSGSNLVYGFDENGNQVSIALIVDGPLQQVETNSNIPIEQEEDSQWIGGQEECLTQPEIINEEIKIEEVEEQKPTKEEDNTTTKSPIKVYRVGRWARTLKELKIINAQKKKKSLATRGNVRMKFSKSKSVANFQIN